MSIDLGKPTSPSMLQRGAKIYQICSEFVSTLQSQCESAKANERVVSRATAALRRAARASTSPLYAGLVAKKAGLANPEATDVDEHVSDEDFTSAEAFIVISRHRHHGGYAV